MRCREHAPPAHSPVRVRVRVRVLGSRVKRVRTFKTGGGVPAFPIQKGTGYGIRTRRGQARDSDPKHMACLVWPRSCKGCDAPLQHKNLLTRVAAPASVCGQRTMSRPTPC